jgi:hypothetical protein
MIPKILHYCWFGRNPYTPLVQKCMASWKEHLPEYELIEWNEDNFDINCNLYIKEAYEAKKWAFVSDYARLHALYNNGGVYLDTDIEVLKPIDRFLDHTAFSGYESEHIIASAIIGAEKGHPWIKPLLDDYAGRRFIKADGTYDQTANVIPITARTVEKYGLTLNNRMLIFGDNIAIYPTEYFCPLDFKTRKLNITENTYIIHHFYASWWEEGEREERLHKVRYREHLKKRRFREAAEEMRLAYSYSKKPKHLVISVMLSAIGALKR